MSWEWGRTGVRRKRWSGKSLDKLTQLLETFFTRERCLKLMSKVDWIQKVVTITEFQFTVFGLGGRIWGY
jgi:hypothetical protein